MPKQVLKGATLSCNKGTAPSKLAIIPQSVSHPKIKGKLAANIMDYKPFVNILPFGMCTSMSNPTVASSTAAAMGVMTPTPCMPSITTPWVPGGNNTMVNDQPAIEVTSTCMCAWGGVISVECPE